jgi:peroxiredoxin
MFRHRNWAGGLVSAAVCLAIGLPCSSLAQTPKDPNSPNSFEAPANFTTGSQLKAHVERLQRVPITQRQGNYFEQYVKTVDKILDGNPPDSLREFAIINLLDGLQQWADIGKNAEADKRLEETVEKYRSDANKKIATATNFYSLEHRVMNPGAISPEDVQKTLDEIKAALGGRSLNAKYVRMANGTNTLINYLDTDEAAEKRFKEFARIFAASSDQTIGKLGNTMRTAKRDTSLRKADASTAAATPTTETTPTGEPAKPAEPADKWIARIEAELPKLTGSDKDAAYEKEKSAFMVAYADNPLRYQWYIFDARRAFGAPFERAQQINMSRGALSGVLYASDAPANIRELASTMNARLEVTSPTSDVEVIRVVSEHIKAYPSSSQNASLAAGTAAIITRGRSEEESLVLLDLLKATGTPLLESAAAARAEIVNRLIQLKTTPLELKFTTLDGKDFDLAQLKGKVVLIDFWATRNAPSVAGLTEKLELYKKFHDQGFEIIGVSFDQDKKILEDFVKAKEIPWPQYFDGKVWEGKFATYGIQSVPGTWLIGRDGHLVDSNAQDNLAGKVEAQMQLR